MTHWKPLWNTFSNFQLQNFALCFIYTKFLPQSGLITALKKTSIKGGIMSEDTGRFLLLQNKYSKLLSWAKTLIKLCSVLDGKFKFSAQDSD